MPDAAVQQGSAEAFAAGVAVRQLTGFCCIQIPAHSQVSVCVGSPQAPYILVSVFVSRLVTRRRCQSNALNVWIYTDIYEGVPVELNNARAYQGGHDHLFIHSVHLLIHVHAESFLLMNARVIIMHHQRVTTS